MLINIIIIIVVIIITTTNTTVTTTPSALYPNENAKCALVCPMRFCVTCDV